MKHLIPSLKRTTLVLVTTVSTAVMLSACSNYGDLKETVLGTRGGVQSIDGQRRMPLLNPQTQVVVSGAPMPPPPMVQQVVTPDPAARNPYDSYDMRGNPIGPKATAEAEDTDDDDSNDNYLSRLFAREPAKPAAAPAVVNDPKPLVGEFRKPIPGNPYYSDETSFTAPVPPGPQSNAAAVVDTSMAANEPVVAPPMQMAAAEPVVEAAQPVQVEENSSWFSRTFSRIKSPFGNKPTDTPPPAEASAPYPQLSSVPPTPEEFKTVKAEKEQQMEALQSDHMQAQQDKFALAAEPSQFDVNNEEPVASVKSVPPVTVQPQLKPLAVAEEPRPIASSSSAEPQLLGHVSDSQTYTAPAPAQIVEAPPVEKPVEVVAAEKPTPTQDTSRQPYWWEGWQLFGEKGNKAAPQPQDVAKEAPTPVETIAPVEPTQQAQPAPVEYVPQPLTAPVPQQASAPVVAPPPVVEAEAEEAPAPQQQADTGSALPSPTILQQVKMLPPSRYSTRMQALQHLDPQ